MIYLAALLCNIQQRGGIQYTFSSLRKLFSLPLNAAGVKIKPESCDSTKENKTLRKKHKEIQVFKHFIYKCLSNGSEPLASRNVKNVISFGCQMGQAIRNKGSTCFEDKQKAVFTSTHLDASDA